MTTRRSPSRSSTRAAAIRRRRAASRAAQYVGDDGGQPRGRATGRAAPPGDRPVRRSGALVDGRRYIAMEWVDGEDLGQHLGDRTLTVADTLRLGRRDRRGPGAAHRIGVIHRDIKPGNIILTDGCPELARLVDFGIAQVTRRSLHRGGTPGFAAPEQTVQGRRRRRPRRRVRPRPRAHRLPAARRRRRRRAHARDRRELRRPRAGSDRRRRPGARSTWSAVCAGIPPALADLLQRMVAGQRELTARPRRGRRGGPAGHRGRARRGRRRDRRRPRAPAGRDALPASRTLAAPRRPRSRSCSPAMTPVPRPPTRPASSSHLFDGDLITRAARCASSCSGCSPTQRSPWRSIRSVVTSRRRGSRPPSCCAG
jgi:serine/threonine protein kinase